MNGSTTLIDVFAEQIAEGISHEVVICPPLPLIDYAARHGGYKFAIGAQDCHSFQSGAYTGFTSPTLLKELGCKYVIIGHSERRHIESNHDVLLKAKAAIEAGLIPIICVGESLEAREKGEHIPTVITQLRESTMDVKGDFIIAYEPIWAIGTGKVCAIEDIDEMHLEIKKTIPGVPILYGGSVKASNARDIADIASVNGFLVGGASLDVTEFNQIIG